MNSAKFVIVGGGMVAGYAAKELVERGLKPGELTINCRWAILCDFIP